MPSEKMRFIGSLRAAECEYHKLRQELTGDLRYGHIRQLDPGNPKSQRKAFFNPNILQELDNHYQKEKP